ncbi:alpha/beta fold hydrolase [Nocardia sp. NPDC056064]|uniref:alpha/beta fold hydrolase n=1 Tax=Nocardia sp. NPDC056064 TaxID=3345701 RepID=UPI0035E042EA
MNDSLRRRILAVEDRVAAAYRLTLTEHLLTLRDPDVGVRVLTTGAGEPVVHINGISAPALGLAPLIARLPGYRHILLDLPGHNLAPPFHWQGRTIRELAVGIVTGTLDALGIARVHMVGSSLGGLCTLWTALEAPERLTRAALVGAPATALPGMRAIPEMISLSTPVRGAVDQRLMQLPSPRFVARYALAGALGQDAARALSDDLLDLHRLPLRLPGQAASYRALLNRLIQNGSARAENVLTEDELARITVPALFVWGDQDVFATPETGRASVEKIPAARLDMVAGGHNPWLNDAERCAGPIRAHLAGAREPA